MSPARTLSTTRRVLAQLRHDHRTVGLLFVVPPILITLLKYVFQGEPGMFERLAPMLLGIFPMVLMFLVTSIATLRERNSGTLERLMSMPVSKLDFILGYALAFLLLALVQAVIASLVMLGLLDVTVLGGTLPTIVGAIAAAFLGTAMGLFLSAFARSEFQAVQFMPAFLFPQLLTCGLFIAREKMAEPLQWFANVMPLTYSVDAMQQVTRYSGWGSELLKDLIIVVSFALVALILGSITIRRSQNS